MVIIIKIRLSRERFIFMVEIPLLMIRYLHIEVAPYEKLNESNKRNKMI